MPLTFLKVSEIYRTTGPGKHITMRRMMVADGDEPIGAAVLRIHGPGIPGRRYKCTVHVHGIRHELESLEAAKHFAEGVHLGMKRAEEKARERADKNVLQFRGKT